MTARMHVALAVADLGRSTDFYTRLFDRGPAKREPTYAKFEVVEPPLVLSLNLTEAAGPVRAAPAHFGIRVEQPAELEALRGRLSTGGLAAREEAGVACCYAYSDKLWVTDPDGHSWELYRRLGDAPVHYPGSGGCCTGVEPRASACCAPR